MSMRSQPLPDQIHIDRVRYALWNRPGVGASVMVGSGFSRNARPTLSNIGELPLWGDITMGITNVLYPGSSESPSPDRALRLAQEYKAAFGRSDLHRLLGQLIQDDSFTLGDMHSRLLR